MALVLYEPTADQYLTNIRKCGNPNYVENNGMPALCTAIDKYCSPSLVETFLKEGANVNQQTSVKAWFQFESFPKREVLRNYGRKLSPLHIAIVSRQFSIVRLLLDNGADPKAKTSKGIEALLLISDPYVEQSSDGKDLKILKLMVQRGSDINVRDHNQTTLLHQAIMATNHDMARYLISSGCDVNDIDKNGETPLYFCQGDMQCAKLLLENSANPNAQNLDGNTVYHQVMKSSKSQNDKAEFLQMLQEYNVDPNIRNNQGQTALHLSLKYLDETDEIVESILEYGADTKVTDNLGRTPAFYLSSSSFKHSLAKLNVSTLNNLLNCGINGERDLNGEPLIHVLTKLYCYQNKDLLSFQRIIACIAQVHHSDVNIRDFQNRTALHLVAAESAEWEIAQVLLKHGADINAMDCDGKTPLHVAIRCERWQMARNSLLWDSPKSDKESDKDEKCVCPNEKSFTRRSRSLPNLPWTPKCLSIFESIFCLEDNYSSFPKRKKSSLLGTLIDRLTCRYFPKPTISKVISRRINATSLFQTCEEHSVGDFHLAEKCDEEKCLIVKQVFRLVADLVGKCEELDPRMKCNLLLTGSSVEGTKMWLPDEFDFMMELTELKGWCHLENKLGSTELTLRKECPSNWSDIFTTEASFQLSPEKLKHSVETLLRKAVLCLDHNTYPNLWFNVCHYSSRQDFLHTTKVGVNLILFWLGEKYKKLLIGVDLTPAIPLVEQYKTELFERVVTMGHGSDFHVIPYIGGDDRYSTWRVSFSLAELQLIRSMSPKQVSLYKCLKFLRDIHVFNITEVPSYPLKCCIFYFVFGDEYIDHESFNFNVRRVLRRLSVCSKAEFCSPRVLRHFFLKDYCFDLTMFDMRWCLTALNFLGEEFDLF